MAHQREISLREAFNRSVSFRYPCRRDVSWVKQCCSNKLEPLASICIRITEFPVHWCFKTQWERERELALHLQGWWRIMGRENSLFWSEKYFFGKQRTGGARLTPGIRCKTVPCSTFWFSCSFFRGKALFPPYFINHPGHREDLPFMSDLWWSKAEVLPECHKIRDASRGKEADLFGDIMCPYMKCFSSYCSWTDRDSAKTRIRKLSN